MNKLINRLLMCLRTKNTINYRTVIRFSNQALQGLIGEYLFAMQVHPWTVDVC